MSINFTTHRFLHCTPRNVLSCDPVYTIETDSLFILDVSTQELKEKRGLTLQVKDFDVVATVAVKANDTLGFALVPPEVLEEATGERLEFDLKSPRGKPAGVIAMRCRPATNYDREFLDKVKKDDASAILPKFLNITNPFACVTSDLPGTSLVKGAVMGRTKKGKMVSFLFYYGSD